jgi:hypothetical protein
MFLVYCPYVQCQERFVAVGLEVEVLYGIAVDSRSLAEAADRSSHVAFTPFAIDFQAVYGLGYQF